MYWTEKKITGNVRQAFEIRHVSRLRNIKRNVMRKEMEVEEEGEVEDLDLALPGRKALGQVMSLIGSLFRRSLWVRCGWTSSQWQRACGERGDQSLAVLWLSGSSAEDHPFSVRPENLEWPSEV